MATTLGEANPLRYRGYIYDTETGLYYLQTRYYNPAMGRFICADVYASTGQGLLGANMFAYCNSNPSTLKDSDGTRPVNGMAVDDKEDRAHKGEWFATKKSPLNGQQTDVLNDIEYGWSTIGYSGCEAIATYNALIRTGYDVKFVDIKHQFELLFYFGGGLGFQGGFGATPLDIRVVLHMNNVNYIKCKSVDEIASIDTPGLFIVTFWNSPEMTKQIHTIAVEYTGSSYIGYNVKPWKRESQEVSSIRGFIQKDWLYIGGYFIPYKF